MNLHSSTLIRYRRKKCARKTAESLIEVAKVEESSRRVLKKPIDLFLNVPHFRVLMYRTI